VRAASSALRPLEETKQAGNLWMVGNTKTIEGLGYEQCAIEPNIWRKVTADGVVRLAIYVNNVVIRYRRGRHDRNLANKDFVKPYGARYNIKILGEPNILLGIEITCDRAARTLALKQGLYIEKIFNKFCSTRTTKDFSVPVHQAGIDAFHGMQLGDEEDRLVLGHSNLLELLGSLLWAMATRRPTPRSTSTSRGSASSCPRPRRLSTTTRAGLAVLSYLYHAKEIGVVGGWERPPCVLVPPAVLCPPGGPPPCGVVPPCGGRLLPPPLRWVLALCLCAGAPPCACGVVPPCGAVQVRAFSPLTRLDPAMSQTPLPFGHRLHAPSTCYGGGPPYAYGSCGAPPEQAHLGTGSHHHATGTGPAAQSSRPTDFQRFPTKFHLCVAPLRPGFNKHGNALAGFNGRQGADAGYGYQRADDQFHLCVAPPQFGFDKHGNALAGYNGWQGADAGYGYQRAKDPTQHRQPQQCSGSYTEDTAAAWQTQDSQPQPQKCSGSYTDDFNPPPT